MEDHYMKELAIMLRIVRDEVNFFLPIPWPPSVPRYDEIDNMCIANPEHSV